MKIGKVGSGKNVAEFLPVAREIKDIEIEAICGRKSSLKKLEQLQETYHIGKIFDSYSEMLKTSIDTVYVALPNNMHYAYAREALEGGKHVIIEKPMTVTYEQACDLSDLARSKGLFIFEAITNQYSPNYQEIKKRISNLGDIKIVTCNYSQYSSRYASFLEGDIQPAFSKDHGGGALMDINIYNLHYVLGLFGRPREYVYYPNIEKEIDTSGILILSYEDFQCVCVGAKDCQTDSSVRIQGNKGTIYQNTPTNVCGRVEEIDIEGRREVVDLTGEEHRMKAELEAFAEMVEKQDFSTCYRMLDHSLLVSEIVTKARKRSGILFPEDTK